MSAEHDTTAGIEPRLPSPLEECRDAVLDACGVRLLLKRDDLIHPEIPGNKWRKLVLNIATARQQGHTTLLTFGGAYSNHVRAVAAAGRRAGFRTIGVIRGEPTEPLNWSLRFAASRGMQLTYLDRDTYRHKREPRVVDALHQRFGAFYLLPEGGSNALAVRGCAELPAEIGAGIDVVCCPCGTGGTLAGIAAGLGAGQRALGFSALKGAQFLAAEVTELQQQGFGAATDNWSINQDFHFGGFAKRTPELDRFIADFRRRHGLDLEWVYVAKMLYGVFTLAEHSQFDSGATIVAVITGPGDSATR